MKTEEAKLILGSTHHHAADQQPDQDLEQALALVETDPELQSWFDDERAFDDAVSKKLSRVEPAADLKASLLKQLDGPEAENAPAHKIAWFRPQVLAAAAAIILVPLIAMQMFVGSAGAKGFEDFRGDMVDISIAGAFSLDHMSPHLPELCAWLEEHQAIRPHEMPADVADSTAVGCKIMDWNSESVSLICLRNNDDHVVHCFIIPRAVFENLPKEELMRKAFTIGDLETRGWADQQNVYLLVGSAKGVKVMSLD